MWAAGLFLLATGAARPGETPPPGPPDLPSRPAFSEEDLAFQRFQNRLVRQMPAFAQQGAAALSPESATSITKPRAEFAPLPRSRGDWPVIHRVTIENGILFLPVPPNARHQEDRGDHAWQSDRLSLRLRQTDDNLIRPINPEEIWDIIGTLPVDVDWEPVRREIRALMAASRFDQRWRILRSDASMFGPRVSFPKRVAGLYQYYKKSFLDAGVIPFSNSRVRAFVAPVRKETRERPGGGMTTRWVGQAWIAPAQGNPLVELTLTAPDDRNDPLTMETLLELVSACRFEVELPLERRPGGRNRPSPTTTMSPGDAFPPG